MRVPRLRPDLAPLRESRDFRLVVVGSFLSGLGAQATLVALPSFPALLRYDAEDWIAEPVTTSP